MYAVRLKRILEVKWEETAVKCTTSQLDVAAEAMTQLSVWSHWTLETLSGMCDLDVSPLRASFKCRVFKNMHSSSSFLQPTNVCISMSDTHAHVAFQE